MMACEEAFLEKWRLIFYSPNKDERIAVVCTLFEIQKIMSRFCDSIVMYHARCRVLRYFEFKKHTAMSFARRGRWDRRHFTRSV